MHNDIGSATGIVGAPPQALASDPHDFAGLYLRHRASFTLHARRYLKDQRDADEVVQEAFLRLFLALPELETELQALAYCRRTITNLAIDRYRADARRPKLIDLDSAPVDDLATDETGDPVVRAEEAAVVRDALAQLPALHRAALVKREIEEKPLSVIADELDIPEDNVKHVLFRARRGMRKLLARTSVAPGADVEARRLPRTRSGGAAALALLLALGLGSGPNLEAVPVVGVDLPDVIGFHRLVETVGGAVSDVVDRVVPGDGVQAERGGAAPARGEGADGTAGGAQDPSAGTSAAGGPTGPTSTSGAATGGGAPSSGQAPAATGGGTAPGARAPGGAAPDRGVLAPGVGSSGLDGAPQGPVRGAVDPVRAQVPSVGAPSAPRSGGSSGSGSGTAPVSERGPGSSGQTQQAQDRTKAAERAAEDQAKAAEKASKDQVKAAERASKDEAKAAERASKDEAKAAERAAKDRADQAERSAADRAAKEQAKAAEEAAKDRAKAAEDRAQAAEKAAKDRAQSAEKAAKDRERAAEDQAKAAEKAAKDRAQSAEKAAKDREKAAEDRAKADERAAKDRAQADERAAEDAAEQAERSARDNLRTGSAAALP